MITAKYYIKIWWNKKTNANILQVKWIKINDSNNVTFTLIKTSHNTYYTQTIVVYQNTVGLLVIITLTI